MPTVVIPYRNESLLSETVSGIRRTQPSVEIIAVDDGSDRPVKTGDVDRHIQLDEPCGLCYCRDAGIRAAKHDEVILLDSHMFFMDNEWAERLSKTVRKNRTCLVNAMSIRCNEDEHDPAWHIGRGRVEVGARFIESQQRSCGRREVLARRWIGERKFGVYDIPCLLGGAYALDRNYYLEQLQGVWQYHRGWGFSEQLICIAQHYLGNPIVCNGNVPIGHLYRTGKQDLVPYSVELYKVLHNQALLLYLFTPEKTAQGYWGWVTERCHREGVRAYNSMTEVVPKGLPEYFKTKKNWPRFYENMVEVDK